MDSPKIECIRSKFMYSDATKVYDEYNKDYDMDGNGYIILGPPGCGKTTYIKNQIGNKKKWIDADDLLNDLGVNWHLNKLNRNDFRLNYLRADYMLAQSKANGCKIIGALFWEYLADAIIIPRLKTHKEYLKNRIDLRLENVIDIRNILYKHALKNNIPIFNSCENAVNYINSISNKN